MKLNRIFLIFFLTLSIANYAQKDSIISIIKSDFKAWQPIIKSNIKTTTVFYNYSYGKNYNLNQWYANKQEADSLTITSTGLIIQDENLGYYVYTDNYSLSGDWFISTEFYYNKSKQLYFVYWRLNTFQSMEPLTIEKRLYFNNTGAIIKNLKAIYKLNTKVKSKESYLDHDIFYELQLKNIDFYLLWKKRHQ